ncbi:MAG: acetate uptake transporter, partial [Rhodanobacteraceae bacterium]
MSRTANISALGYGAFAVTLWLASMASAGWFRPASNTVLLQPLMIVLGGCVLAATGILKSVRENTLDTVLFLAFAAYWWVAGLAQHNVSAGFIAPSPGWLGWYYIVWSFLAFCIWIAACRDGVARMLFTLGLCLSLLAYALAAWVHLDALTVLGGYLGLVTAVVGIYIAAAEMMNGMFGHVVLPLGESTTDSGSTPS